VNSPILDLPIEERVVEEKKRLSLASTFDQLVTVNMHLTQAVGRLVRVSYVLVVLHLAEVLYRSLHK
jgi:hypothetical protein